MSVSRLPCGSPPATPAWAEPRNGKDSLNQQDLNAAHTNRQRSCTRTTGGDGAAARTPADRAARRSAWRELKQRARVPAKEASPAWTAQQQAWARGHRPLEGRTPVLPRLTDNRDASPTRQHAELWSQAGATWAHEGRKQAGAARRTLMRGNQGDAWPPGCRASSRTRWGPGEASGPGSYCEAQTWSRACSLAPGRPVGHGRDAMALTPFH